MFDYSQKISFDPIDAGSYEATIETAEYKKSSNGRNYIALKFLIRKDVDQKFQGRYVFDSIWELEVHRDANGKVIKKEDYEKKSAEEKKSITTTLEYQDMKVRTLIQAQDNDVEIVNAQGIKEPNPNFKVKFEDMDEVVLFLNGLNVKIQVNKYVDDNTGEERNQIDYRGVKRTAVKTVKAAPGTQTQSVQPELQKVEIDDSDLPF